MVVSIGPFKRPLEVYFPGDGGSGTAEVFGITIAYYYNNRWSIDGVDHMIIAGRIGFTALGDCEVAIYRGSNMANLYYFAPHDYCNIAGGNASGGTDFIVSVGESDVYPWWITHHPDIEQNEFIYDGNTIQVHVWGQNPDRSYIDLGFKTLDFSGLVLTSRFAGAETYFPVGFFLSKDHGHVLQVSSSSA